MRPSGASSMATFQHTREVNITNSTFLLTTGAVDLGTTSRALGQDHANTSTTSQPVSTSGGMGPQRDIPPANADSVTDSTSNLHPTIMRTNAESHVGLVVRADHDIYYNQLLVKGRGSPMWIPGPDLNLPKAYRREGVMIGDVGILYTLEGFSFLFNIFLPATHPINIGRVPDDFEPLDYSRLRHEMKKQTLFGPSDYLASSSMQKLSSVDSFDLIFETSATEGAVLTMPDGATTEDLMSRKSIRQYIAKNAESWYSFVREVREREVENGDIRLVVGYDRVSSWGIATFASSTGHHVRLEFRGRDDVSTYRWNCVGSGSGRVGPYEEDIKDLRQETDTADLKNQCVFLRTLNFTLAGEVWDNLMVHQVRSSLRFPGGSSQGDQTMPDRQPGSSGGGSGGRESSSGHGVAFHGPQFGLCVVHPANAINGCLLEQCPKARIAITEDEDWMSVIAQQDIVFPGLDELCSRLLAIREAFEEDGEPILNYQDSRRITDSSQQDSSSKILTDTAETPDYGIPSNDGPVLTSAAEAMSTSSNRRRATCSQPTPPKTRLTFDGGGKKPAGALPVARKTPSTTKLRFTQNSRMSSDHRPSANEIDHSSDEEMIDGTQIGQDEDDEMDIDNEFFPVPPQEKKSYEVDCDSLDPRAVETLISREVDYICSIFIVDGDIARLLLRHMKWNKEKLIEKYMDSASKVLVDAGATLPEAPPSPVRSSTSAIRSRFSKRKAISRTTDPLLAHVRARSLKRTPSKKADHSFVCQICLNDEPGLQTLALDCDHTFCKDCWNNYVLSNITDEREHAIRCMADGCALIAPDQFILEVLLPTPGSPEDRGREETNVMAWTRFQELIVRHYVACNKHLKFCPYPSCTNTVSCPSALSKASLSTVVPIVSCGARGIGSDQEVTKSLQFGPGLQGKEHKFCFGCPIESDHRPPICAVANMWSRKCRDVSETAHWIKSNIKQCPQCLSAIEKYRGCNHMACMKCRHEFCWVCMGPWSEHGIACNRYDEKARIEADDKSKSGRYLHYYTRWANHEQSAKLSLDIYPKTEKEVEEMQIKSGFTWIDVQFMKKAVEEVEKGRMTLKWSYAMAYYLANGNGKELFEDNQRDLERAVEDLSELIESPMTPGNIHTLQQSVTNKTVYVQKRNEIVLEYTADGFLEERWKWNVSVEGFDDPEE